MIATEMAEKSASGGMLPALAPDHAKAQFHPGPNIDEAVRAAVVLTAMEPDVAASVLSEFSDARIKNFARAMTRIGSMSASEVDAVLEDFILRLQADAGVEGGETEARRYLAAFMDDDGIDQLMDDIAAPPRTVWQQLEDVPEDALCAWLSSEHPQVAAVTLSQISPDKSARMLETFEPGLAQQIVLRMSEAASAAPEAIERIAKVVEAEILPQTAADASKINPANLIAAVLNQVSGRVRDELMGHMRSSAETLAEEVRRVMFTFEDIPDRVEPRDVAVILKAVDDGELMIALKPEKSAPITQFFLENITKRMADRMRGDMEEIADPEVAAAEAAQSAVISAVIGLRDSGAITLKTPST